MQAQKDIIYPAIGKVSIRKCKITNVKDGNTVYYIKDSISNVIEAVAIKRNGVYITLNHYVAPSTSGASPEQSWSYEERTYEVYNQQYQAALKQRNVGIGITVLGVGAGITAALILRSNTSNNGVPGIVSALYFGGGVLTNAGIIVWVSGGIKASNNKNAMKMVNGNTSLSFGLTNNGVGLLMSFN